MTRVYSKFLEATEDKFGIPAVAISRGIYSAAIIGYLWKVVYPGLKSGSKRKTSLAMDMEEDQETVKASQLIAKKDEKDHKRKQGPAVNKVNISVLA